MCWTVQRPNLDVWFYQESNRQLIVIAENEDGTWNWYRRSSPELDGCGPACGAADDLEIAQREATAGLIGI